MASSAYFLELEAGTGNFNNPIVPQKYVALSNNIYRATIGKKRAAPGSGLHAAISKILQRQLRRRWWWRGRRGSVGLLWHWGVNRRGRRRGHSTSKNVAADCNIFRAPSFGYAIPMDLRIFNAQGLELSDRLCRGSWLV